MRNFRMELYTVNFFIQNKILCGRLLQKKVKDDNKGFDKHELPK